MRATTPGAETRRFGRHAGLLSAGVAASGLLTYFFFSLAGHNLSAHDYGEITVLWSVVFVTISVAHRPVELLLSRTLAERRALGAEVASALRIGAAIQLGVSAALAAAALALREPLQDGLLSGSETLYWVLVVAVVAFGPSFYARGYLAGHRRFALLAALLCCEAAARAACALAVAVGLASGQTTIALGIAAAPLFSLIVVPAALLGRRGRTGPPQRRADASATHAAAPGSAQDRLSIASGGGFAAGVLVIMLGEQTMLNAGPLLARAFEDATAAGFVFNVLMVARAPLLVFQGVAQSLLPHLTRLGARGAEGERAARHSIAVTLGAIAAFTALTALVVGAVGPTLLQLAFGDRFEYDRLGLVVVAFGMGAYLTSTTLNQAILARGGARLAARSWAIAATSFLVWCLLTLIDDIARRVELGFTGSALLLALLLAAAYRRRPVEPPLEPDSAEEIEARLAQADEVS